MSFHVFLSHSSCDKPAVEELARRLAKEGIEAWLDKWHLIPGDPWQLALEKALAESESCAVFVGPSGFGPWQNEEMRAAIDRRVQDSKRRFRVIPVLLPGAERAERSSLPTFLVATTWVEFRDSLDDQQAFHRLVCGIRGVEPGTGPGQALYEGQCPYRGLRVFDVDDAAFFFGREALVQWLLNAVHPGTEGQPVNRFLAIVGASGSGKSSVARAGLVAAIKRDDIPASSRWPVAISRPGLDPVESLAVALSRAVNVGQGASALSDLIAEFRRNERTLHLVTRQSLPENAPNQRLVILVDQFEEIFTLCRQDELREALIRNLLYAAKVTQGQTLVILTMRADFYAKCAANAELAAAFSDHHVLVGPMTEDELLRAIERPAQAVGCELESGLADLLVQDVARQPGALPLLQHALLELWHKRKGRRLTVRAYQEIGKLEGALQRRADATLQAFSKAEQELCRRTFLRLTQPGEGTEDTKRRASMHDLLSLSQQSAAEEDIVQKLVNASLLTTEGDLSQNDAFVEVAHEALIRIWPQLRKWIDADRAGLRTRTRLTEAARDWKNSGRDPAYLYTGARLAVAKEWEASHPGELSADEAEFLGNSLAAQSEREASELEAAQRLARAEAARAEEAEKRQLEEKASGELRERLAREKAERQEREIEAAQKLAEEQKRRAELSEASEKEQKEAARRLRRRAIAAAAAAAATVILLVTSVFMWLGAQEQARIAAVQRSKAEEQAWVAEIRRLAAESSSASAKHPQRGVLLAVEAVNQAKSFHGGTMAVAEQSLRESLASIGGEAFAVNPSGIGAVAISADCRWLARGSSDGTVRLWNLATKDPSASPAVLTGHEKAVNAVAFTPDNRWLASGSVDGTARLWDLTAKDPASNPVILRGDDRAINTLMISADNHWLVSGNDDGTVGLWDPRAKDPAASLVVLGRNEKDVGAVTISPDSHWVVTGSSDGTLRLWDIWAKDPALVQTVVQTGHEIINADAIRPDGSEMYGGMAIIKPSPAINALAVSPDNRWLIAGSRDGTLRLWDLTAKNPSASQKVLLSDGVSTNVLAISADSHWLVTGSSDGTARLWDLTANDPAAKPVVLPGNGDYVCAVAISMDDHWIATGSDDGSARLWDLRAKDQAVNPVVLRGHETDVVAVAISADDRCLVTAGNDGARICDLTAGDWSASPVVLRADVRSANAVAISPDNRWVVTGSSDNTARLWDLSAKDPAANPIVLRGHESWVNAVAISPDNRWVVTGSDDNTARLWDLSAKDPAANPIVLRGHEGGVNAVAISPDNHWLATGSADGTARLWDLSANDPAANPVVLRRHESAIDALAISSDSHWLVTGDHDGEALLWDLTTRDPAANFVVLRGHESPVDAVAISPDNHWLVTCSDDGTVGLWNLRVKDPAASCVPLLGHEKAVLALAISSDSHWLVTGSFDRTARLWDLTTKNPAASPVILRGHESEVEAVAISPDNRWVATSYADGTVGLWLLQVDDLIHLARAVIGRNFSVDEWKLYFPGEPYHKTFPD
jgi:WD40 repeat protein